MIGSLAENQQAEEEEEDDSFVSQIDLQSYFAFKDKAAVPPKMQTGVTEGRGAP